MNVKNSRRGVLLLIILALMAMFALVAITWVLVASQYRRGADAQSRIGRAALTPQQDCDQAMRVVTRGSDNPASAINANSLLEKIYSNDSCTGTFNSPQAVLNGSNQLWEFTAAYPGTNSRYNPMHWVGCVLTVTNPSSPAYGLSTRIVGVDPSTLVSGTSSIGLQCQAFENGAIPNANDSYLVNGFPYSGMGFGFQLTGGSFAIDIDSATSKPVALLPRHIHNMNPPGGANCDYTAADYQDTLLGLQIPYSTAFATAGIPAPVPGTNGTITTPWPSLHRPELCNYWSSSWATVQGRVMFRPSAADHPNFTGSNPAFTATAGPWDVDNDGDGVPDSVWVDVGLPVRFTADGRPYKPLVAILCLDMDGRFNLNAHGTIAQSQAGYYSAVTGSTLGLSAIIPANTVPVASPNLLAESGVSAGTGAVVPRGLGYGPADINLMPLLKSESSTLSLTTAAAVYQNLLQGAVVTSGGTYSGRYGALIASAGTPGLTLPNNGDSYLSWNKWFDYGGSSGASNYWSFLTNSSGTFTDAYGSPPDTYGDAAIAVDVGGRPLFMAAGGYTKNNPYGFDLTRNALHGMAGKLSYNDPFSIAEFERVLRPYDRDSTRLSPRLLVLSATDGMTPSASLLLPKRYAVTTESWAVNTPATALPPALSGTYSSTQADRPRHPVDLLFAKLASAAGGAVSQSNWPAIAKMLLPPEMLAGLKLNLNRPLCNWRPPLTLYDRPGHTWSDPGGAFNLEPYGAMMADSQPMDTIQARQRQARYLYVLLLLVSEANTAANPGGKYTPFFTPETIGTAGTALGLAGVTAVSSTVSQTPAQDLTARRLAQWAINAVCFSTPDSAMIPFRYDINPFTSAGWRIPEARYNDQTSLDDVTDSSGKLISGVVWGCKPPELLLTETVAFHDRRVADTNWDDGDSSTSPPNQHLKRTDSNGSTPPTPGDQDLDQPRTPQGSLFAELYCPRNTNIAAPPPDLYTLSGGSWALDLGRMTPNGYPVWRLVVSGNTDGTSGGTANSAFTRLGSNPDTNGTNNGSIIGNPNTASLEPQQVSDASLALTSSRVRSSGVFSLLSGAAGATDPNVSANVKIDRIIWLSKTGPTASQFDANRVYWNRGGTPTLLPGMQYALVGPRVYTNIGAKPSIAGSPLLGTPSGQQIVLSANSSYTMTSGSLATPASKIKPALGIVVGGGGAGTNYPPGWSNQTKTAPNGIGISVSEPLYSDPSYYPEPTQGAEPARNPNGVYEWYGDPNQSNATNGYFLAHPLEQYSGRGAMGYQVSRNDTLANLQNRPLVKETQTGNGPVGGAGSLLATGTYYNYKTLFLQRVANPSLAYDPVLNPYRTVDWLPIDLTVYNGDDSDPPPPTVPGGVVPTPGWTPSWAPAGSNFGPWDPDDANDPAPVGSAPNPQNPPAKFNGTTGINGLSTAVAFTTRQRGDPTVITDGGCGYNIWTPYSADPAQNGPNNSNTSYNFPFDLLGSSLGYINPTYGNGTFTASGMYAGDPSQSFPWLTWYGRPYASPTELLWVPTTSSGRLLAEFTLGGGTNNVNTGAATGTYYLRPYFPGKLTDVPFAHLLPFFQSSVSSGTASLPQYQPTWTTTAGTPGAPQFHRLFEYVGVPPRFIGAETQINPNFASAGSHCFHPPFNQIPAYREPGRINLNTITNPDVFQGLLNYFPNLADPNNLGAPSSVGTYQGIKNIWPGFVVARRGGYPTPGTVGDANLALSDNSTPTRFCRPFRSFAWPALVPPGAGFASFATSGSTASQEIDGTLLRRHPQLPQGSAAGQDIGLLQVRYYAFPGGNYNRNPYARLQAYARLGNLVTTRSNVFAVWITVGYFQVTPAGPPYPPTSAAAANNGNYPDGRPVYPDGYQLGPELGSDTGEIERHRSFYIIDRTIPVGFQRGMDLNVEKAIVLRRFIE